MATAYDLPPEPRPGDFSARIKRSSQRGIAHRQRRKTRGRSALAMLGAVALPAFAQPASWDRFQIGDAGGDSAAIAPMPFEQAGLSFPGSAFYYLDDDSAEPGLGEGIYSDAGNAPLAPPRDARAVARPMFVDNSGIDRERAEQCLAAAIYYEAASESDAGQRAVAQVVLNRVAHPSYPGSVCGVVYQGSERVTGCQFSFTCDGSLARKPSALFWNRALNIARDALNGHVYTPIGLATHYHTVQIYPYWAPSLAYLGTIGAHRFYSFKGAAGRQSTFRFAYAGSEPLPARHKPKTMPAVVEATPDPLAIQRSFEATSGFVTATNAPIQARAESVPVPLYSPELRARGGDTLFQGNNLPDASGIRPEFRNSGRWIAQPKS